MSLVRSPFAWAVAGVVLAASSFAQSTEIMSVDSNGVLGNNYSGTYGDAISADGRFVAFGSGATNLVPGGSPLQWEVFLHDRLTGATVMVSVDSAGNPSSAGSFNPAICADGSSVAFETYNGLESGDTNGRMDVYVHDFTDGSTTRMSVMSNGLGWAADPCSGAAISGDARFVSFTKSHQTTMYHHRTDLFLHDRQTGNTATVNVNMNGVQTTGTYSSDGSLSYDGHLIAFQSTASDLVGNDTNASYDIFVRDMLAGVTTRVSLDSSGAEGNDDSLDPAISSDGRFVAFSSVATNLVPGDVNGKADIFVHNIQTGATVLASVDSNGVQADADCLNPWLSADGRFVSFHSTASNLVAGDTNNVDDVFVHDLWLGTTECVSVGLSGAQANGASDRAHISADGRYVSFVSFAGNLASGDTNGTFDVFARDRGSDHSALAFCFGEGTQATACPCANSGAVGHGCANSVDAAGALLAATGATSPDALVLGASQMLPSALCVYLQGDAQIAGSVFGDGVRCAGGQLLRLAVKNASSGASQFPEAGDPSVSARSAALGDLIPAGGMRFYQTYYRDPDASFCPAPSGNTWNVTNGVAITW